MTVTTTDHLEKGAEYCERRPFPIDSIELSVTRLGIFLRWSKQFSNDKWMNCGRYVGYQELERCHQNPIILTAKQMEREIIHTLREKNMIIEPQKKPKQKHQGREPTDRDEEIYRGLA